MRRGMSRRGRGALRGAPHRPAVSAADRDAEPTGERVRLVRWGRIWAGLVLIGAGIAWLAINNALGIYTTPAAPTVTPIGQTGVALGTAQSTGSITVNAKAVGSYPSLSGKTAPAGERYLVIAVQVTNRGASSLVPRPQQFSLQAQGASHAGAAYAIGHATLFARPLAPRATGEGYLTFMTSTSHTSGLLRYDPGSGMRPLSWRVG